MKKLIGGLSITILLGACGAGDGSGELAKKVTLRDSLQLVAKDLDAQIKKLNQQIAELDTNIIKNKRQVMVNTMEVRRTSFQHFFQVQGVVEADKNILISPEMAGVIQSIQVEEGQQVSQGQVLLSLDTDIIQRNIDEVKTALELAEEFYTRQQKLWEQKIGSEMQYLEAKSRKESLDKKLKTLQTQLAKAVITAPASGMIDEIMPKRGEMVMPGFPLIRLVNLSEVYLKAEVSENYHRYVSKGKNVEVIFPSLKDTVKSKISRVGNYINPDSRTFKINVDLKNPDEMFKPNLLAVIKVNDFEDTAAVVVPSTFLLASSSGKEYVYVIRKEEGKTRARQVSVQSGLSYQGYTMITGGDLKEGEMLITEGARSISEGEEVHVKN